MASRSSGRGLVGALRACTHLGGALEIAGEAGGWTWTSFSLPASPGAALPAVVSEFTALVVDDDDFVLDVACQSISSMEVRTLLHLTQATSPQGGSASTQPEPFTLA